MSLILAIESSCGEMAMAILKDKREFLSSVVASQIDIHAMYGRVVPEIASRKHVQCVSVVLKETLKKAQENLQYLMKLEESYKQLDEGKVVVKTMEELEAMADE